MLRIQIVGLVSKVFNSTISLFNVSGGDFVHLTNYSEVSVYNGLDGLHFNVTLTERQRVNAIAISGTPGGDGGVSLLNLRFNLFNDIALNPSLAVAKIVINENADTINPKILSGTIHYGLFTLIIRASEIIDTTPASKVNLAK